MVPQLRSSLRDPVGCIPLRRYASLRRIRFLLILCTFCATGFTFLSWTHLNEDQSIHSQIGVLQSAINEHQTARHQLQRLLHRDEARRYIVNETRVPVLVIACNRPSVSKTLNGLLAARNQLTGSNKALVFPIVVSQGCRDTRTTEVLASYSDQISVIEFDYKPPKTGKRLTKTQLGYQAIASHYKFALDYMFIQRNHSQLIIVEDDLNIAPDFFDYFGATLPLLHSDPTLFCVSAWNDNGRPQLINQEENGLVYRSDFFSGLGWMLLRNFWLEIRADWPDIFWDEYLRKPFLRKNRACLHPELSRTTTFGRIGISHGQYFDKFLKTMHLNEQSYSFGSSDLSYLSEPGYTHDWLHQVYMKAALISFDQLKAYNLPATGSLLRVTYTNQSSFKNIANFLGIMVDVKSGVMRNAFHGIVPVYWEHRRLFIAPMANWTNYANNWT